MKLQSKLPLPKLNGRNKRILIVASRFNDKITLGLLDGAIEALVAHGVTKNKIHTLWVPGAFEIPLAAKKTAKKLKPDGVIALGCIIKGDTAHFEYVASPTATGIMQVSLDTGLPIGFGILTTYTTAQALKRAKPGKDNKGREAALAVLEML